MKPSPSVMTPEGAPSVCVIVTQLPASSTTVTWVYLPSTVAPAGSTPGGLPVGVQIVGPQYGDRTCIDFAHLLEQEYRGFVPPPGYA